MKDRAVLEWLLMAVRRATESAVFCVTGSIHGGNAGIEVDRLGAIPLPLDSTMTRSLVALCEVAPYGQGTSTLVNRKVRNTWELSPEKFRLSESWKASVATIVRQAADELGLPSERLEATLYKLLIYEKGGFFQPHRDSEKLDGMVASLIVVLPSSFQGGELVVRHKGAEKVVSFNDARLGRFPVFAAFYADCEHEVRRVSRGIRLCLTYNLTLKSSPTPSSDEPAVTGDALAEGIRELTQRHPAKPLVFALDHQYTQRGMSLDLLKGGDRKLADLVVPAAEAAGCMANLAQVSRHLVQFADDGSFENYSRRWRSAPRELSIGETYEDELDGDQWRSLGGKKQPWGALPLNATGIISSVPIDDWKPTSEEFEGYTGNAGNTLDRWYHRTAIVLWRKEHLYDVLATAGAAQCVPAFCALASKVARAPKKRREEVRTEALRFARAIIGRWPARAGGWGAVGAGEAPKDRFQEHLLLLHDRETISAFLRKLADSDSALRIAPFVLAACSEFGIETLEEDLLRLLKPETADFRDEELGGRDVEWLCAVCCAKKEGERSVEKRLCAQAVERFCKPRQPHRWARETTEAERSLEPLLKALLACGQERDARRVLGTVQESDAIFRMDFCQVPCLKSLVPWSMAELGNVPAPLREWLAAVRQRLQAATAHRPEPPADWARPKQINCRCALCGLLQSFLADPGKKTERIVANEDGRQHLIRNIDDHKCDVDPALDRSGRPYALVLTKNLGSHQRAVAQFDKDRRLLGELADL